MLGAVGEPSLLAGANTLGLSWSDTNSLESGYEAQVSNDGGATWFVKGSTGKNGVELQLQHLTLPTSAGQSLLVRVRATDALAPAGALDSQATTNPPTAVSGVASFPFGRMYAPQDPAIASFSAAGVELRWRDTNVYESGHELHLSSDEGMTWQLIESTAASGSAQASALVPASDLLAAQQGQLSLRVRAKPPGEPVFTDGPASSDHVSNSVVVVANSLLQPAGQPSLGAVGPDSLVVSWFDTNVFEAGYEVQTSFDATNWEAKAQVSADATTATATGVVFPGASTNQVLFVRVRTRVPGEPTPPTAAAIATQPIVYDSQALRPATNLALRALSGTPGQQGGQARLEWVDTNLAEGGYQVQANYAAPGAPGAWIVVATVGANASVADASGLVLPADASQHLRLRVRTMAQGEAGATQAQVHSAELVVVPGTVVPARDFTLYGVNPLAALVRLREANLPAYSNGYEPQTSSNGGPWIVRAWGGEGLVPSPQSVGFQRGAIVGCVVPCYPLGGDLRLRLRTLRANESPRADGSEATSGVDDILSTEITFALAADELPELFPPADLRFRSKSADGCELVFTDTNIDESHYTSWITYGLNFPPGSPNAGLPMYYRNASVGEGDSGSAPPLAADGAIQRVLGLAIPYEALEGAGLTIQRRTRVESVSRLPNGSNSPIQPADSVNATTVQEDPRISLAAAIDWGGELLQAQTPGQPTGLHARPEDVNLTTLTLRWTDQSGLSNRAHTFEVQRLNEGQADNDESWDLVGTLGSHGLAYTGTSNATIDLTGMIPSRTYKFRVRSSRQGPWSATSATVVAGGLGYAVGDQLSTTGHPGASALLRVASIGAGGSIASLQVLSGGEYGYKLQGPTTLVGGQGAQASAVLVFGAGSNSGIYTSGWSNVFVVQMATPVATPSNLSRVSFAVQQATVGWDQSPNADGYQLRWSLSSTGPWTVLPGVGQYFPANKLEELVTGLQEGSVHYFEVRAVNTIPTTDILSPWSDSLSFRTRALAPTGLAMTPGTRTSTRVGIQWQPQSAFATHVRVERRASNEVDWTPIRDIYSPPGNPDTNYVTGLDANDDDGIEPNTRQVFRVRALHSVLTSGSSTVLADPNVIVGPPSEECTIDLCACDESTPAPTPTVSNATTASVRVSWPAFPNATNYLLRMSTTGLPNSYVDLLGEGVHLPGGAITSYTVTGLQEGAQYWFKLLAYNTSVQPVYRS
ncbi:MAG: hypothetical protein RL112_2574, partial [Planctomycetota bacterium]